MSNVMSDTEYVRARGVACPFCGSGDLEVIDGPQADGSDCWQEVQCRDCGKTWRDVYRLVGYEGTDEEGNYRDVEGKPRDPQTGIYLVVVEGDIDPHAIGPFADDEERDKAALAYRAEHGDEDGIFMLTVDENRRPDVAAYAGVFFEEAKE